MLSLSVENQPVTFTLKRVEREGNESDILQTNTKGGSEVPLIHQTRGATFVDAMDIIRLYFDPDADIIVAHGVKFVTSKDQETEHIHSRQCSSASISYTNGQHQLSSAPM